MSRTESASGRAGRRAARQRHYGLAVHVEIENRCGPGKSVVRGGRIERFEAQPGNRPREKLFAGLSNLSGAKRLAGLAHSRRLAIVKALMNGATSHKDLRDAVSIKPGPLYFHLRHLERVGLIQLQGRSRYEMTRAGSDLLVIVAAALQLIGSRGMPKLTPSRRR
ncbi:MAG: winged helix-turn-helix transcriptional regulator [Phycisphaerae bacterium]|nr:winged helix-turn-helix domain-containing protein [Phycisphaerae bacterium]NUQ44620.1 winged helix-turn-helix transcriptional regulator [Phycisphaerae bacterium]